MLSWRCSFGCTLIPMLLTGCSGDSGIGEDLPSVENAPRELPANGEICDGIDNDGNGLIDDADVENDGVCDCLKIASLGVGGASSDGQTVFANWPNARSQNPVMALGDRKLSDALLQPFEVLIVLDVATMDIGGNGITLHANHAFSDAEVAALQRWVQAGGGMLTTTGYSADEAKEVVNVNRLLTPFGMAYSTKKLDVDGYVEDWVDHPITEGVHKIFTANGVEPDGAHALTLAKDTAAHVVLQVPDPATTDARVIAWGDEWITYESQWKAQDDQQVERFWLNSLAWLSPSEVCQTRSVQ
jgi:hypothetical protein